MCTVAPVLLLYVFVFFSEQVDDPSPVSRQSVSPMQWSDDKHAGFSGNMEYDAFDERKIESPWLPIHPEFEATCVAVCIDDLFELLTIVKCWSFKVIWPINLTMVVVTILLYSPNISAVYRRLSGAVSPLLTHLGLSIYLAVNDSPGGAVPDVKLSCPLKAS